MFGDQGDKWRYDSPPFGIQHIRTLGLWEQTAFHFGAAQIQGKALRAIARHSVRDRGQQESQLFNWPGTTFSFYLPSRKGPLG